jgi:hypothetical protein
MAEEPPARLHLNREAVERFSRLASSDVAERTIPVSPFMQPEPAADALMKLLGRLH